MDEKKNSILNNKIKSCKKIDIEIENYIILQLKHQDQKKQTK